MIIGLFGNPNSGKTSLYNQLTGSTSHVGNWPGVTVEKRSGKYLKDKSFDIVDLPGIYSLSPYTPEEIIAREFLNQNPDAIINIVDATNLERNLYLTSQLIEHSIPMIVALNFKDVADKRGEILDVEILEKEFGVPFIHISATKNLNTQELMNKIKSSIELQKSRRGYYLFKNGIKEKIKNVNQLLVSEGIELDAFNLVKVFELEDKAIKTLQLSEAIIEKIKIITTEVSAEHSDEIESIVANARYEAISIILKKAILKKGRENKLTENIDKVVTNRFAAIPIFILIMSFIFAIVFADGIFGIPMPGIRLQGIMEKFVELIQAGLSTLLVNLNASSWAQSLVVDAIVAGVGAVFSFMPHILLLFLLLSILEDTGYMARVAFILDGLLRKIGLSGKSVVPLIMGFGCSVPAIMAARTIENENDRKLTIMLTPFISCSAKLPIWALFAAAIFSGKNWYIIPLIYFTGILVAIVVSILLKKTMFKGSSSTFIMEMPPYRLPNAKNTVLLLYEKLEHFIVKAGTIILSATIIIWVLQYFTMNFRVAAIESESILANIANFIVPVFRPLGFASGEHGYISIVATITGIIAKESVVSIIGVLGPGISVLNSVAIMFTPVSALSFMVFNLLIFPCFATIGTLKQELNSNKTFWFTLLMQFVIAYTLSLLVFQVGSLIFRG